MAKPTANRLLIMGTGATTWDRDSRLQGSSDLPLSPEGREQVEQVVGGLGKLQLASVFAPPDEASMDTARLLAAAAGCKVLPVEDLSDLHLGLWEGLRQSELEARYARAGRQWLDDPAGISAPDGEAFADFETRLLGAIQNCITRSRTDAPIGIVLRSIGLGLVRCRLSGASTSMLWSMVHDRPGAEWYDVEGKDLRLLSSRAEGKTVTAA